MKTLVFLLVLVNALFYAFSAGYFGRPQNPDAHRVEQQLMPERMRIVSRGEAPKTPLGPPAPVAPEAATKADEQAGGTQENTAAPSPTPVSEAEKPATAPVAAAVAPAAEPAACLAWNHLAATDADRVAALLAGKFPDYRVKRQVEPGEGNGWWVFIPPLAGKAEADKKASELRALEVTDYFVLQDGASRYAISLGVFSSEKGAQERLNELKAKGVRSAKLMPRPGKDATVTLTASGPGGARGAVRSAVAGILPKTAAQACP